MASQESSDTTQAHQQLLEENSNMKKQIDKLNSKLQEIKLGGQKVDKKAGEESDLKIFDLENKL